MLLHPPLSPTSLPHPLPKLFHNRQAQNKDGSYLTPVERTIDPIFVPAVLVHENGLNPIPLTPTPTPLPLPSHPHFVFGTVPIKLQSHYYPLDHNKQKRCPPCPIPSLSSLSSLPPHLSHRIPCDDIQPVPWSLNWANVPALTVFSFPLLLPTIPQKTLSPHSSSPQPPF